MPSPPISTRRQRPDPGSLSMSGSRRRRASQTVRLSSTNRDLNKFDVESNEFKDLMNDWELGGHQNPWVCPSDRHLQLRAQLKSGWSVRTATARSPTTTKQQNTSVISDAEQEQIRKVLARAELGRQHDQERIGKMVDRLEKMRIRATGNGVTQCLICQTEFGLLSSKSYAAMCIDCRKYVCQKNCGVETFDQKRGETIFLCKICSEYREVMWKKSGAWFYKEMPTYTKPESPFTNTANGGYLMSQSSNQPPKPSRIPSPNTAWPFQAGTGSRIDSNNLATSFMPVTYGMNVANNDSTNSNNVVRQRQLPIPPDQQQRLKTVPRPRITPSWVHEKVQSSMSIGSDDEESSSSSADATEFKQSVNNTSAGVSAQISSSRRHAHNRPRELKHGNSSNSFRSILPTNSASTSACNSMQRYTLTNKSRITDTEESENDESRRTTPSTSPRHSLATPSSYGGDDLSQNHITLVTHETSDAKSIDSGVVNSDHSIQQLRQQNAFVTPGHGTTTTANAPACISPPLKSPKQAAQNPRNMGSTVEAQFNPSVNFAASTAQQVIAPSQPSRSLSSTLAQNVNPTLERESSLSILNAPPIPPRSGSTSIAPVFCNLEADRRPSSGSTSTNNSQIRSSPQIPSNLESSHESLNNSQIQTTSLRLSSTNNSPALKQQLNSRESLPIMSLETDQTAESPTFMSSPEDDTKVKEPPKCRKISPVLRISAAFLSLRSSRQGSTKSSQLAKKCDGMVTSSSTLQLVEANSTSKPLTSRWPTVAHEGTKDESSCVKQGEYAAPPRRPMSANCLLTTIDESVSSQMVSESSIPQLEDERPETIALDTSQSSDHTRHRSGTLGSIQFNLTYLVDERQLIIHLIRAKNLKAMDKNGLSDPYVKFHLIPGNTKATKLTSKTIEKTLNPEWNQEMIYYGIMEEERQKKTLRVTVLDRDRIGSDFLGETRVALKKLPLGQTKKFNLYLEHAMPAPSEKNEETERGKILVAICYNIQQGSLFLHIKRCAELLGMDSTGLSDPYCKVSLTPISSKMHRQRTTIKKRTLNPEFNENLQFIVPFKDLPRKALEIRVYDHDVGRHDDFIGGILLSTAAKGDRGIQWTNVIENPGKTFEMWHKLESD